MLHFSGGNLYKVLQSSQTVPVYLVVEFPASNTQATSKIQHTHTHSRINMDPTVSKRPNQLGQLSEMYSLAKAHHPYLQQYPITAKHSVPSFVLCCSLCSTRFLNLSEKCVLLHQSEHLSTKLYVRLSQPQNLEF